MMLYFNYWPIRGLYCNYWPIRGRWLTLPLSSKCCTGQSCFFRLLRDGPRYFSTFSQKQSTEARSVLPAHKLCRHRLRLRCGGFSHRIWTTPRPGASQFYLRRAYWYQCHTWDKVTLRNAGHWAQKLRQLFDGWCQRHVRWWAERLLSLIHYNREHKF